MLAAVGRAETPEQAVAAVRGVRRRELFRTAAADLIDTYGDDERSDGPVDPATLVDRVGTAVYGLTSATLAGALRAAVNSVTANDTRPLPTRFAVIGMGRFGGRELGYGSDADVLFVHEPREGADSAEANRAALAVADELRRLLQIPTADPPLLIDADLRPEGKSGPLVRSLGVVRRLLPPLVADLGEPGAAARRAGRGRRGARRALRRADRPAALPGGGAGRGGGARDPPAQGAHGVRADAARRRPDDARQARPRRAVRRRVDRPAPPAPARGPAAVAAHHRHPQGAGRRARGGPDRRRRRRHPGRGVGAGHPGAQRGDAGPRPARRHLPRRRTRTGGRRPLPRATRPATSATCWRTTAAAPAGPARSWNRLFYEG